MKQLFGLFILTALMFIVSCGEDDEPSIPENSVTVTFDGTTYTKSSDDIVTFLEFSFNDVTSFAISGVAVNGTDTIELSINIPVLAVATYSKSSTNDENVSISISTPDDPFGYSTDPFFVDEDPTDYTLNITEVTDKTVSGNFTATLYDDSDDDTVQASGEFVAVDFALFFTGFQ